MQNKLKVSLLLSVAVGLAIAVKASLLYLGRFQFNADEAVVALMGRHILQGERPVFFYGQAYMGSLDAWLVALGFGIFGQEVWVIRLVQIGLYVGVLLTSFMLAKLVFNSNRIGIVGVFLLAIPTVNVTLYTTVSLGGYGEALLLGNLILIAGIYIGQLLSKNSPVAWWLWAILGLLVGTGIWAFGLTLIYSLPICIYILWSVTRSVKNSLNAGENAWQMVLQFCMFTLAGFLLGSAPWWSFAIRQGWGELLWELSGGAIAGVENLPFIRQVGQHVVNFLLLGISVIFGFRPPWSTEWLGLVLLPFVLIFWMGVLFYSVRDMITRGDKQNAMILLASPMVVLILAFFFTPFGADPSGRYFVPAMVPLALFAANMIISLQERIGQWSWAVVVLVMLYNLLGTVQSAIRFPPGLTTQFYGVTQVDHRQMDELIAFLVEQGETHGYTNYWVSYPLAFLSSEKLVYVPRLPYHLDFRYTDRDDRYQPYDEMVTISERAAYITTNHPELNEYLRNKFAENDINWKEKQIGDYSVFYGLDKHLKPEDVGLGTDHP